MIYADEALPSQTYGDDFIWATRTHNDLDNMKTGKWIVFSSLKFVDDLFLKITEATNKGILGPQAKVSMKNYENDRFMICIYTQDWTNLQVMNTSNVVEYEELN